MAYDSGVPPLQLTYGYHTYERDPWRSIFPKRTRVALDRRKLESLRLRETSAGNRRTVDVDAVRVDVAQAASEIEREWLYQVLLKRYALPTPANAPSDRGPASRR